MKCWEITVSVPHTYRVVASSQHRAIEKAREIVDNSRKVIENECKKHDFDHEYQPFVLSITPKG